MEATRSALTAVYLVTAVVGVTMAVVVWRRRGTPGGAALAGMIVAAAVWAVFDAIELGMPTVAGKRLAGQFQYVGIVSTAPFFFHAALGLAGRRRPLAPAALVAVWGVPLVTLGMAVTSQWHQWLWRSVTLAPDSLFAVYHYGFWFWVLIAQNYVLVVIGTAALLGASTRVARPFRAPLVVVIIAALLPALGNAAYVLKLGPWPGLNWFTLSITISGVLLAWVILREGLLDLLPRAREALVGLIPDGVVVLSVDGAILFANQAATALLQIESGTGRLPDGTWPSGATGDAGPREMEIEAGGTRKWIDVRSDLVRDRWGEAAGRLLVARDISRRKALEAERENLIAELQGALHRVRTLEELLPICAGCHNVRDDEGYWRQIDEYLSSRAGLQFTPGLCPACAEKLYGPSLEAEKARGGGTKG